MQLQGIIPPIVTPHLADGAIDEDGFRAVVDHLIGVGVHALIVGGTTGEYYAQSTEERVRLMTLGREAIGGRVPMIVGVGAIRTEDCIAYAEAAKAAGADAILVNAPYYAVPTQLELAAHVLAIDRAVDMPIVLYNYPARTGAMMDVAFLDRVGQSRNIVGIKESSGDIDRLHLLARDYPHIPLMCGMDDQALEFFAWGAEGWICGGGNCLPAAHLALYEACVVEGDFDKGRRIMSAILPFMRVLEQGGKFVQTIKYVCELEGIPAGPVRAPLRGLTKDQKREVETVVRTLKTAVAEITGAAKDGEAGNVVALNA